MVSWSVRWLYIVCDESGKSKSTIKANITNIKGFLHAFRLKPTPTVDITNTDEDEDPKYQLSKMKISEKLLNTQIQPIKQFLQSKHKLD